MFNPLKRKRPEDLPRKKRLDHARLSLLSMDWIEKCVIADDGVVMRPDGTFALKLHRGYILTKTQLDEIVSVVTTESEGYVKLSCEDGRLVVSVENQYPPEAHMRRKARIASEDPWWKNLPIEDKNSDVVSVKEMWSNEIKEIPSFDKRCGMTVENSKIVVVKKAV